MEEKCPCCKQTDTVSQDRDGYACFMCDYEWSKPRVSGLIMPN